MAIEFEAAPDAAGGDASDLAAELWAILDWAADNLALAIVLPAAAALALLGAYSFAASRKTSADGNAGDWGDGGDGCGGD